jgi:hypothetical protein
LDAVRLGSSAQVPTAVTCAIPCVVTAAFPKNPGSHDPRPRSSASRGCRRRAWIWQMGLPIDGGPVRRLPGACIVSHPRRCPPYLGNVPAVTTSIASGTKLTPPGACAPCTCICVFVFPSLLVLCFRISAKITAPVIILGIRPHGQGGRVGRGNVQKMKKGSRKSKADQVHFADGRLGRVWR